MDQFPHGPYRHESFLSCPLRRSVPFRDLSPRLFLRIWGLISLVSPYPLARILTVSHGPLPLSIADLEGDLSSPESPSLEVPG